jgi:hypothetical protein
MRVTFHSFTLGDVDLDVYSADEIYRWQQTEQGQWAMKHARDLKYYTGPDLSFYGYAVRIQGIIDDGPLLTEYLLRWKLKEY